jgi:hypothetical protein
MDHEDGRCASEEETLRLQGNDLAEGIMQTKTDPQKHILLLRADTTYESRDNRIVLQPERRLAIVGMGTSTVVNAGSGRSGLQIESGIVFVRDLTVSKNKTGIRHVGGQLTLRDISFDGNQEAIGSSAPTEIQSAQTFEETFAGNDIAIVCSTSVRFNGTLLTPSFDGMQTVCAP